MKKRSVHYHINTAISLILVLGIVIILGIFAARNHYQWDLTRNKRFTLAPQSVKILKNLKEDVKILAFYAKHTEKKARDLLDQYTYNSKHIKYEFIDPNRDPRKAREYEITKMGTVIVECGEKREKISRLKEEELTNAIIKAIKKEKNVIYFLTGHGERSLKISGPQGLTQIKEQLEKENYNVQEYLLMRKKGIPSGISLLAIIGPRMKFQPEEFKYLKNYLDTGGRILFLADIDTPNDVVDFFKPYGIKVDDDLIIDPSSRMVGARYYVTMVAQYEQQHPVTANFSNIVCFFPMCRSLTARGGPPASYVKAIAKTTPYTWGIDKNRKEVDGKIEVDPKKDKRGPLDVAAAGEYQVMDGKKKARIVAIGSTDFITNSAINLSGNFDFFMNSVAWLTEQEDMISIRPKRMENTPVFLTQKQKYGIVFFGLVFLPLLLVIIAIIIWIKRR
ncbi:MAG: GldG family protein [Candidatus Eremiobacteraeota bacterium]|nr:GldG family protein [Candidatus Eremiobacteraeota bacterium]